MESASGCPGQGGAKTFPPTTSAVAVWIVAQVVEPRSPYGVAEVYGRWILRFHQYMLKKYQ